MKYCVVTFGCRVNQADSVGFDEALRASGATATEPAQADLIVVNTCTVTASADQGARQAVRRLARANPAAEIVVTGCYATRRADEVAALPNVARIVPNDDKPRLMQLIRSVRLQGDPANDRRVRLEPDPANTSGAPLLPDQAAGLSTAERFGDGRGSGGAAIEPGTMGRTAFTLRVQTGCAERCTYCIVPATRGKPRSVPVDEVSAEVARIVAAGFKELRVTGVHLGSYGRDLTPPSSLVDLLHALAVGRVRLGPDPDVLFRLSSLEPMDCTPEVIDLVATFSCFAPHFHLPLQHASRRVLAAMGRPYSIEAYASLVDRIRARLPHAAIGSDVIVGFPGETDDEFEQLVEYLARSPLTHLHVFPYSARPGTVAAAMSSRVGGPVIRERARRVRDIARRLSARFRASQVGAVRRGLTLDDGSLVVTGNYLKVRIPPGRARNEWVAVTVTEAADLMTGEIAQLPNARVASR